MVLKNIVKIIDIEASGFGLKSYPIEIAWRSEDGSFDSFLIIPHEKWTFWCKDAEKNVHHISRETLFNNGISIDDACLRLNKILGRKTLYSDNAKFDQMWIDDLFYYSSLVIHPSFKIKQINSLYFHMGSKEKVKEFNLELNKTKADHRALDDCDRYITAINAFWPNGLINNSVK
jgi:hypothetical protein